MPKRGCCMEQVYRSLGPQAGKQYYFVSCFSPASSDKAASADMAAAADKYGFGQFKDDINFVAGWVIGNMVADANKGISAISYNHLGLPVKITFGTNRYIEYLYDANGTRMQKKAKYSMNLRRVLHTFCSRITCTRRSFSSLFSCL